VNWQKNLELPILLDTCRVPLSQTLATIFEKLLNFHENIQIVKYILSAVMFAIFCFDFIFTRKAQAQSQARRAVVVEMPCARDLECSRHSTTCVVSRIYELLVIKV
jgi:hypothetical protein